MSMNAAQPLHGKLSLVLLSGALLLVIGGCSLGASTPTGAGRTTARVGATDTAVVISSLTATQVPSPTLPAYLLPSAPLLPAGWSWYRNSTAHFQVPLAPGWRAGGYYGYDAKPNCFYNVQFFAPGEGGQPGMASGTYAYRLISIGVNFSCPSWPTSINPEPYITQEPDPIFVDGQSVTVYDNNAAQGEIECYARSTFGGRQYAFDMQSRLSDFVVSDVQVFKQMLHGFAYTGN